MMRQDVFGIVAIYTFYSSLMIVLIAMLVGMYDLPSLVLIFVLNAMMNLFGHMNGTVQPNNSSDFWTNYGESCIICLI
jgi:hypothetical protein